MKNPHFFFLSGIVLAPIVAGQTNGYVYSPIDVAGGASQSHNYDVFVSASQKTNITRSVPIPGASGLLWHVNVSSVSVPDGAIDYVELPPLLDPQVVQTVYDIQFPGGGSLDSYINSTSNGPPRTVCANVFIPPYRVDNFPSNVTDRYSEDDNDDCGNVLGEECVAAFIRSGRPSRSRVGCFNFDFGVPECTNTLRASTGQATLNFGLGNGTAPNGTTSSGAPYNETQSGYGFYSAQTGAFNGSNITVLNRAENRLQVMALTNLVPGQRQLLCQRVGFNRENKGGRIGASLITGIIVVSVVIIAVLL